MKTAKKTELTILKGLDGKMDAGKLTALLGASGSGKTTLLDVLAGRKNIGKVEGTVLFAGQAVSKADVRHLTGYVEQFDTLVGELSVRDMLMYTAELKLPRSLGAAARAQRVRETIDALGLGVCEDTVIGGLLKRGISGGQAKRCNVALAMITQPQVIFLDEPTSGLDSHMANEVVASLAKLARDGRTIVATVHSPSSRAFAQFDDLLMLNDGALLFAGPIVSVQPYFEGLGFVRDDVALPEWIVDLSTEATGGPGHLATAFKASMAWTKYEAACADLTSRHAPKDGRRRSLAELGGVVGRPNSLQALWTLTRYRMATHYQSGEFLGPRIGDKIFCALIILTLYWDIGSKTTQSGQQTTAALFYFVAALCGYGAFPVGPAIIGDRPLFYREYADGCYTAVTYYLHKFLEEAVLATLTSCLFALLVWWACSLKGSFLVFVLCYYLTTMLAICLTSAISCAMSNAEAAGGLLATYVTTCMYFGGLYIVYDEIPPVWYEYSYTSFLRYAWGAFMNNHFEGDQTKIFMNSNGTAITILDFYGMEGDVMGNEWACLGFLFLLICIYSGFALAALGFVNHSAR